MKKKLLALFLFVMIFGLQINMKAFASTLDISKEVYVSGPTFGNSDVDSSGVDIQEIKLKTNLNFSYEWITKDDNTVYNDELAKAAILFATDMYNDTYVSETNAFGKSKDEVAEQKQSFTEAISALDLDDFIYFKYDKNDIQTQDVNDVTGVTIGNKKVNIDGKDYTLYIAVLDTTQGATEWMSNFDIGADIDGYYAMTNTTRDDHPFWIHKYNHKGFDVAANRAKTLIDSYINITKADGHENTILICGHSRGGAIANILGALYEDDDSIKSYTYTFGTPNTVEVGKEISESKVSSYKTIFNHVNNDDFVTIMPNENWGFRRYGKTISLTLGKYDALTNLYNTICNLSGSSVYASPKMHALPGETKPGIADAIANMTESREQLYTKQTKTITFADEASRDSYFSSVSSTSSDLATFNISKGSDSVTAIEEYYYDTFLELLGELLGNRSNPIAMFTIIPKLQLVAKTDLDINRDGISRTFSLPYYLEEKIYDVEDAMVWNIGGLSTPHQTAAYVLMTYFRDIDDLGIDYSDIENFTGEEIKPEVTITDLTKDWSTDDYSLTYEDNIEETNEAKIKINSKYQLPDSITKENFISKISGFNLIGNLVKTFSIIKETPSTYSFKKIDVSDNSNVSKTSTIKNDNDKEGTVILNSSKVRKGSKVEFEVVPNDGFKVKEVLVKDKNGNKINVSKTEGNNFEFTMPNSNIDIEVIYEEKTKEEKEVDEINRLLEFDEVVLSKSKEASKLNSDAKFIKGYDTGEFKPENEVSNIELMSMITSLYNNVEIRNEKVDLNQGEDYWGELIIKKAHSLNLIPGDKNNKNYDANEKVTRGDLAVVIYNLLKDYSGESLNIQTCSDIAGKTYEKEVTKLINLGIIKGCDDGLFHGEKTLTRAEAVTIINRTLWSLGYKLKLSTLKVSFPDLNKSHWAYNDIMFAANK